MKPKKKEIKIKCLQGQMKESENKIDCKSYPRGMKNEVLAHHNSGYLDGMIIGVDMCCSEYESYYEELLGGLKEDYINGTQEGVLVEVVLIAKEMGWDDGEA